MAIFPLLNLEDIVQTNDKTRLDATKSFVSKDEDAITLVEIEPEVGEGFIEVGSPGISRDWYLDWIYAGSSRTVTVTVRITTSGTPVSFTKSLLVKTIGDDKILSFDSDLTYYENDILRYIKDGRSSFINFHRAARDKILDWLNSSNYVDVDGNQITKDMLYLSKDQLKEWSTMQALELIYASISNSTDDVFIKKSSFYSSRVKEARNKAVIYLDLNNDGEVDKGEFVRVSSVPVYRR